MSVSSLSGKMRGEGRARLIAAARLEFEQLGYEATNSNAIARRAGFAPQTFYRHFQDKKVIFLEVYALWVEQEVLGLADAQSASDIGDLLIEHHRTHQNFRRSLRDLTSRDGDIAHVRAEARQKQMRALAEKLGVKVDEQAARLLAQILIVERLCDAIVENEFGLCGVTQAQARAEVIDVILSFAPNLKRD